MNKTTVTTALLSSFMVMFALAPRAAAQSTNADQKRRAVQNLVPTKTFQTDFVPAMSKPEKVQASINLFAAN